MNKHLSALWVISGILTGCAAPANEDGSDEIATEASAITAGHVTLGVTSNSCGGGPPQLIFFGTDSAGRETYDFNAKPFVTNRTFCDIRGQILFPANYCIRLKGSSFAGRAFLSTGAFGTISTRAQWLQVAPGLINLSVQVPVSTASVPFTNNIFLPSALSPRGAGLSPGLQLIVTPSVTASGGVPGQPPTVTADFSFGGTTTTLEAVPC